MCASREGSRAMHLKSLEHLSSTRAASGRERPLAGAWVCVGCVRWCDLASGECLHAQLSCLGRGVRSKHRQGVPKQRPSRHAALALRVSAGGARLKGGGGGRTQPGGGDGVEAAPAAEVHAAASQQPVAIVGVVEQIQRGRQRPGCEAVARRRRSDGRQPACGGEGRGAVRARGAMCWQERARACAVASPRSGANSAAPRPPAGRSRSVETPA